jgi:hypothetical protein
VQWKLARKTHRHGSIKCQSYFSSQPTVALKQDACGDYDRGGFGGKYGVCGDNDGWEILDQALAVKRRRHSGERLGTVLKLLEEIGGFFLEVIAG